tara:strand:+ start:1484 stop:1780 length:297 start_codon:yes stop_codon:yes gene_type:complete
MGALNRLAGLGGCELIANTTERTGKNYDMIAIQEDTVIATLTGTKGDSDKTATNFLTTIGLGSATLKQGLIIAVPAGSFIDTLELTSGSVMAYKASEQ